MASWPAKIGTLTVVGAALLGAAYDGLGLMDRLGLGKQTPVATGQNTDPAKAPTVEAQPVAMELSKPKAEAPEALTPQPDPEPEPEPEPEVAQRDPRTKAMEARLRTELERLGCEGVTLDVVTLSATETPAAEASSGFDTIYLEGNGTLRADGAVAVINFAGSGKGPGRDRRATEMAAKGFAGALQSDDIGRKCTELETQ